MYASEKITEFATVSGTLQQTLSTMNETVLIPARDTLTIIAVMKSGKLVTNLVLRDVDPILIRNPQKWIEGKGEEVVRGVIEDPAIKESLYDAGTLKTAADKATFDALSLKAKIATINTSNLANLEQERLCEDAELTKQAIKDVSFPDGTYINTDYIDRKKELYDALCGSINDSATKAAVLAVSNDSFNWNKWQSMTVEGVNTWSKEKQTLQVIKEEQAKKTETAKTDLANGKGIRSETKCTKYAIPGNTGSACLEEIILRTGDVLGSSFQDALKNPLALQLAGFGKGAGSLLSSVASIAGTVFTTIGLLDSISGGLGGGGGSGSSGTSITYTGSGNSGSTGGSNTSVATTKTYVKDLVGNNKTKRDISDKPIEQLEYYKNSLIKLIQADISYLGALTTQKNYINSLKSCYVSLVNDYPLVASDARVTSAQSFYTSELNKNSTETEKIIKERDFAQTGTTIIADTIAKIEESQSSEEILDTFLDSQDLLKEKNIPSLSAYAERESKIIPFKDEMDKANAEGGDIYIRKQTCDTIRQEEVQKEQFRNIN
jgi:hypothetical protein